jgi:hypothetical protein
MLGIGFSQPYLPATRPRCANLPILTLTCSGHRPSGGEGEEPRIEGLLSLEEIGRLVEAGTASPLRQPSQSRSRATEQVVQAQDFLKSMGM